MDKKEVALQILITAMDKGYVDFSMNDRKPDNAGKVFADIYNAILNNLSE